MWSGGCKVLNADHCGNQQGDATCRSKDPARPYCSVCNVEHDGCMPDKVVNPDCWPQVAGSGSTTTAADVSTGSVGSASVSGSATTTTQATTSGAGSSSGSSGGPVCGDGIAEGDEVCDGMDLRGKTCMVVGSPGGTLGCHDCLYDASECEGVSTCGDGMVKPPEVCDDPAPYTETCASLTGRSGGTLECVNCQWNTTRCCDAEGDGCDSDLDCRGQLQCKQTIDLEGLLVKKCK